jgi:KDO2-lipid IV(A) lauroyltransferase
LVVYWLFRLTIALTRPLPLWLGYWVAGTVAGVCYHFFGRQRRALNENMAWLLQSEDPREVDAVAKRAFRNFGKFVIDFVRFPVLTRDEARKRLVFQQWEDLDEAVGAGRGVIIVTMHFGVFDLGAAALAAYDYQVQAIAENYGYRQMDELIHGSRERLGLKVIPVQRAATGAFRALKRGELLALLIDVPTPETEITVNFLGAPATVSSAPARIALRTGAWVVPAIVLRGPQADRLVRPILDTRGARYEPTGDEERDVRELTQRIMASFERHVREHPEQWFIFRPMWTRATERVPAMLAAEPK